MRKLKNRSGTTSIQIISKEGGRYRVVETVGTSGKPEEIEQLYRHAQRVVHRPPAGQEPLFSLDTATDETIEQFTAALSNASVGTIGPELIFGRLFDRIGFNHIDDELFRHLVIARLAYPTSKRKTVDYLYRYKGVTVSDDAIYRFLDRLHNRHKKQAEQIACEYTRQRLKQISIVFYDVTTLYFEAEDEDDLRKIGYSKDGKMNHPQIMLGLLVGEEGLPIGYDVFKGNTFEGHTLIPTLDTVIKKYGLQKPVVIADSAMLSKSNLKELEENKYQYIVGARIKNESEKIKQQIIKKTKGMSHGDSISIKRADGRRLIVTCSERRAKKDAHNRKKGLNRLAKHMKSGTLTKASINNRGYNKFLTLEGDVSVTLNEEKIKEDQKWDGLKGYISNTRLWGKTVTANYAHLWQIEKAFRISKTDLRIRPVYHYRTRRIEAHICIAFVTYTIYKELELLLKRKRIVMSAKRAGELTHTMYQLGYILPDSHEKRTRILLMDEEQQQLYDAVHCG